MPFFALLGVFTTVGKPKMVTERGKKLSAAIYSASAVDNATVCCFFELQATAPPAIVVTYPLMDFWSESFPQLASQKKLSSVLLISASFPP